MLNYYNMHDKINILVHMTKKYEINSNAIFDYVN